MTVGESIHSLTDLFWGVMVMSGTLSPSANNRYSLGVIGLGGAVPLPLSRTTDWSSPNVTKVLIVSIINVMLYILTYGAI